MPTDITKELSFLITVLIEIRDELKESNRLFREANKKFDDEDARLSEQVNEAILQNNDISQELKELNRVVDEEP